MDIIQAAFNLKGVPRQGWLNAGVENPESVAAHSYGTAILSMIMADMEGLDVCKAVRMALLHDLAESIIGDIIPGHMPHECKREMEQKAMDEILGHLPEPLREQYASVWREYARQDSPEAAIVRDADRLDMALQAKRYKDIMKPEDFQSFMESYRKDITGRRVMSVGQDAGL